jgi:hypothetical protein
VRAAEIFLGLICAVEDRDRHCTGVMIEVGQTISGHRLAVRDRSMKAALPIGTQSVRTCAYTDVVILSRGGKSTYRCPRNVQAGHNPSALHA